MTFATPKLSPSKIKQSLKRKFSKTTPPNNELGGFPRSLSPILPAEDFIRSPYTRADSSFSSARRSSILSEYSPTTTISSSSSSFTSSEALSKLQLQPGLKKSKGPTVKPYIYTQSQQLSHSKLNKNIGENKCFICGELIQNKLEDENILELKCGDFLHEQCFTIQATYSIDKLIYSNDFTANRDILANKILPICKGDNCRHSNTTVVLSDVSFYDSLVKMAISKSIEYDKKMIGNDSVEQEITSPTPRRTQKSVGDQPETETLISAAQALQPPINLPIRLTRGESMFSFASSTRGTSPNPSISTVNTDGIKITDHMGMAVDDLKDRLLKTMLTSCPDMNLTTIMKLGNLRLADEILTKRESFQEWALTKCYLFDDNLVVIDDITNEPELFNLRRFTFSTENGSIRLTTNKLIWLHSESPKILEKWCIALLDFSSSFPAEILTSTLTTKDKISKYNPRGSNGKTLTISSFSQFLDDLSISNEKEFVEVNFPPLGLETNPSSSSTIVNNRGQLETGQLYNDSNTSESTVDITDFHETVSSCDIDSDDEKITELLTQATCSNKVNEPFSVKSERSNAVDHHDHESDDDVDSLNTRLKEHPHQERMLDTDDESSDYDSDQEKIDNVIRHCNWQNLIADLDKEINSQII